MITLGSNIYSLRAQRHLGDASAKVATSIERLASGLRINRASDDAAGLSLASSLNASARIFGQGIRNINDGISFLSVAEGALNELRNVTSRQQELAEQAANGTFSVVQRRALDQEANALVKEYNRIIQSSSFNGINVFAQNSELRIQIGTGTTGSIALDLNSNLSRNVGDGTFETPTIISIYTNAQTFAGDFDSDGHADLLNNTGYIQFGNGDGSFDSPTSISPNHVRQAQDFNGDGKLDLVTNPPAGGLTIHYGNGNGTFRSGQSFASQGANAVESADLNGDGSQDLLFRTSYGYAAILNDGDGNFSESSTYHAGYGAVATGDLNADGRDDFVIGGAGTTTITILSSEDGGAGIRSTSDFLGLSYSIADFNHDGFGDLLELNGSTNRLRLGNGDGTFRAGTTLNIVGPTATGDINNDGFFDLVANSSTAVTTILGNGDGTFRTGSTTAITVGASGYSVFLADLTADGVLDALALTGGLGMEFLLGRSHEESTIPAVNLLTQKSAQAALTQLSAQADKISAELGVIGAGQNRLESAARTLATTRENYLQAASRIQDVDVAEESAKLTGTRILQQAAAAVLAQANQSPNLALILLGGS